jgi:hypothetical protein
MALTAPIVIPDVCPRTCSLITFIAFLLLLFLLLFSADIAANNKETANRLAPRGESGACLSNWLKAEAMED